MHKRRRDLRHLSGWLLHHQCSMCDIRGSYFLGVYPAGRDEAADVALESLEVS